MEISTDLYVQQLINQRNAAANEAALALAQCHHLMAENGRLSVIVKELSDINNKTDGPYQRGQSFGNLGAQASALPDMITSSEGLKNIKARAQVDNMKVASPIGKRRGPKPKNSATANVGVVVPTNE